MPPRHFGFAFFCCATVASFGASLGACAAEEEDSSEASGAIVGNEVANDEHPEVVRLSITGERSTWTCTGTLVGRRTILTARHCLGGAVDERGGCKGLARVDLFDRGTLSSGAVYDFERCVDPALGRLKYWDNDLALVRLAKPVAGVIPARLATARPPDDVFTVYGYGSHGKGKLSGDCAEQPDGNKRKYRYRGPLGLSFGQATCEGDSGGPHFVGSSNIVAAVTSGGALAVDANATIFDHHDVLTRAIAALEN